jgi:hypothetical protein
MKRNGGRRPSLFDMAFLLTRYRAEMGNPTIPKVVQQVIFPIVVFIGTISGRYGHFKNAPEPVRHASGQGQLA